MGELADRRFTALLEAAPDAMVCADLDGRIALVNAQAERLFGYTRGELVGQPVEILVPDDARQGHPSHRAGYMADPRPRPMGAGMQLAGRRRDGSTFPADISLSATDTDEGILITAAVRDATERLAAETTARLASIVQSSYDAVVGQLQIYSEAGLGATCTAYLPATNRSAIVAAPAADAAQRGHGEQVLVVEDEPAMREVTRRILARSGYQLAAVAGGREALAALTHRLDHVELLLTDVIMPHM